MNTSSNTDGLMPGVIVSEMKKVDNDTFEIAICGMKASDAPFHVSLHFMSSAGQIAKAGIYFTVTAA
jgi:hypothetical protein